MKGLIYSEPADLLETGERSKGNEPDINTLYQLQCFLTKLSGIDPFDLFINILGGHD